MNIHEPHRAGIAARHIFAVACIGLTAGAGLAQEDEPKRSFEPVVDDRADRILRAMSDYLGGLRAFTFEARSSTDVVTEEGQKLEFSATSEVAVQRPNRLRSDRRGSLSDVTLTYDGDELQLYGRKANAYAKADAPRTLDEAIDFARDSLSLEAPGADLLYSASYPILMEDVVEGRYIAEEMIDGVRVHHLAFRGRASDFQIWIEAGPRPLPRKYIITSKDIDGSPDFEVEIDDWDVAPVLARNTFNFTPPRDAMRIDFLGVGRNLKSEEAP